MLPLMASIGQFGPLSNVAVLVVLGGGVGVLNAPAVGLRPAHKLIVANSIPSILPGGEPDPGLVSGAAGETDATIDGFHAALAKHRHPMRDTDPPRV
ncbi:hypothetical protein [Variovorax sp. GT1P44]|uniref:hypothetical protein n=1 Tax=Variovorax sp. GT1P44 TaxID=3443742 RepID=UPI003F46CDA2